MIQQCVQKCVTCEYWICEEVETIFEGVEDIEFCSAFYADAYEYDAYIDDGKYLSFPYPYPCNHYVFSYRLTKIFDDAVNDCLKTLQKEAPIKYKKWVRKTYNK